MYETLLHRCDQVRDGEGFPLDTHDASSAWHCQLDSEIKPAAASAEGDEVEGTYSHIHDAAFGASSQSTKRTRTSASSSIRRVSSISSPQRDSLGSGLTQTTSLIPA